MAFSKYFAKRVWLDGYCFDSEMEADYYKQLKEREAKEEIDHLVIHPMFMLQEGFTKDKKYFNAINYEADFKFTVREPYSGINYVGEHFTSTKFVQKVVDIKGMLTDDFIIKQKLFEKKYPEYHLEVLAKDIDGQFKPIDEVKANRKERKKIRKKNKKEKEWLEYDELKLKPKRTIKQEARFQELAIVYANKKHKKVKGVK